MTGAVVAGVGATVVTGAVGVDAVCAGVTGAVVDVLWGTTAPATVPVVVVALLDAAGASGADAGSALFNGSAVWP